MIVSTYFIIVNLQWYWAHVLRTFNLVSFSGKRRKWTKLRNIVPMNLPCALRTSSFKSIKTRSLTVGTRNWANWVVPHTTTPCGREFSSPADWHIEAPYHYDTVLLRKSEPTPTSWHHAVEETVLRNLIQQNNFIIFDICNVVFFSNIWMNYSFSTSWSISDGLSKGNDWLFTVLRPT
jgi:hypothetical protein